MRIVKLFTAGISAVCLAAGLAAAQPAASPAPAVTPGRQAGDGYGPPAPAEPRSHATDDPAARREWFMRQRAYPGAGIPRGAYEAAAAQYQRRLAATRRRQVQNQPLTSAAGGPALPSAAWTEIGPAPISPSGLGTIGNVSGRIS